MERASFADSCHTKPHPFYASVTLFEPGTHPLQRSESNDPPLLLGRDSWEHENLICFWSRAHRQIIAVSRSDLTPDVARCLANDGYWRSTFGDGWDGESWNSFDDPSWSRTSAAVWDAAIAAGDDALDGVVRVGMPEPIEDLKKRLVPLANKVRPSAPASTADSGADERDPFPYVQLSPPASIETVPAAAASFAPGIMNNPPAIALFSAGKAFANQPVPARRWVCEHIIPRGVVTMLQGDGGGGKSTLALQLAVAVATGTQWIGRHVARGKVLVANCEDNAAEVHRRLDAIRGNVGLSWPELADLWVADLSQTDATLWAEKRDGEGATTALYQRVLSEIETHGPFELVIVDGLADVFGGNENSRRSAKAMMRALQLICDHYDATVALIAHTSRAGLSGGDGQSGSTGWNNAARSRLYLTAPNSSDGSPTDRTIRELRLMKSNYAPPDLTIALRYTDGFFAPVYPSGPLDRRSEQAREERVFLNLLGIHQRQGRPVSAGRTSASYAPTVFSRHHESEGIGRKRFEMAMERLLSADRIRNTRTGPPSKQRAILVLVEEAGARP